MTSKDKTGDQLVASIRKSKSGEVSRKNTKRRATSGRKKTSSARKTSTPASKAAKTTKDSSRVSKVEANVSSDSYSAGGRIWPD
jgi:cytoskeletal protein RodZ